MTGTEPEYNPEHWSEPLIEKSHNCYAYFLDDKIPKVKLLMYNDHVTANLAGYAIAQTQN